ncbi:MAG: META domain-containing protein [Sphingomonadales bacterium]|nr:META domain-containing protein [Sphingomonadales bacterium]MDE2569091.1 META domain-containing protein [Sphingomonadales bacterium]
MKPLVAIAIAVTAALGGCTTAQPGHWSPAGTKWRIVGLDGAPPSEPGKAMIVFSDDRRMSASVGCNSISGGYSLEDGRLMAKSLVSSLIGCENGLASEESALIALLSAAPQVSHHGDRLQLDSGGHTVELEKAA